MRVVQKEPHPFTESAAPYPNISPNLGIAGCTPGIP
jgi:hypothetical protein